MENQNYADVLGTGTGNSAAPFISSLAQRGATVPNYHSYGATTPVNGCSAGCYLALTAGTDNGLSDGWGCCVSLNNLFNPELKNAGLTYKLYCEAGCGRAEDHFPFIGYSNLQSDPNVITLSGNCPCTEITSDMNSASPANFYWLTPTDNHNMHDNSIQTGDSYLQTILVGSGTISNPAAGSILSTSLFTNPNNHTLLYLWWDEYDPSPNVFWGKMVKTGFVSPANNYDEYSSLKTIESNWGLTTLTANDAAAPVMADIFGASTPVSLTTGFTIAPPTAQVGQSVAFTAMPSGGTSPYTDTWTFGDGSTGSGPTVSHSYTTAGTFQVALTTQDSASPAATASLTKSVTINPAPLPGTLHITISSNPSAASTGQSVSFTAQVTGGSPPYGVGWDFGDGGISVGLTTTHAFSQAGTANVTAAVTDSSIPAKHAVGSIFVTVTSSTPASQPLSGQFSISPSTTTVGTSVTFTSSVSGGATPYTYSWDFGDSIGTSILASPSYSYSTSGSFTVTFTVTDANGATASASHTVTVNPTTSPPAQASGQYCTTLTHGSSGDLEPLVAVNYVNPASSASYSTSAVFDTGSKYSLAPASLATSLGLDVNSGTPVTLTGVGSTSISAHVFYLTLTLGGSLTVANVPVAITDSTNQFLIGRMGFLGQVGVSIDPSGQNMCFTSTSSGSGTGSGCQSASDDDDGDSDDRDSCDNGTGDSGSGDNDDTGDTGDSDDGDSGDSGANEDYLQPVGGTTGGVFSGAPMLLITTPLLGLAFVTAKSLAAAPFKKHQIPTRRRRTSSTRRRRK